MTRHYSTRDFKASGVLPDFDFSAIKETNTYVVDGRSASDSCPDELQRVDDSNGSAAAVY